MLLVERKWRRLQIADALGVKITTVDTYILRAREKLGGLSAREAARVIAETMAQDKNMTQSGQAAPEVRTDAAAPAPHPLAVEAKESASDHRAPDRPGPQVDQAPGLHLVGPAARAPRPADRHERGGLHPPHGAGRGDHDPVAAAGSGAARGLPGLLGGDQRRLGPNTLGAGPRLAVIAGLMILCALAFGSIIAGLQALEGLTRQ
ncbi:MAG: hypothetical protein INR64_05530 [Caulobacteraceae bacterium]|nr:hypothetical protein [Caulobacter sp.]